MARVRPISQGEPNRSWDAELRGGRASHPRDEIRQGVDAEAAVMISSQFPVTSGQVNAGDWKLETGNYRKESTPHGHHRSHTHDPGITRVVHTFEEQAR